MSFDLKSSNFKHLIEGEDSHNSVDYSSNNAHEQHELPKNAGEILHSWQAPEFEAYEKSTRWYLVGGTFIALIVLYALFTDSPMMAVTFILLGIVGFIHLQKDPRVVDFAFTSKGVLADNQLYSYENIYSFWIFYEEPNIKIISLHTKASMLPYVHIPIHNEDPVELREILITYIPEIKQDTSLIDALERVLHI